MRSELSGWAQCNGRDELDIRTKAKFDGEYVRRFDIWFDIKVLFLLVFRGFSGKGEKEGRK